MQTPPAARAAVGGIAGALCGALAGYLGATWTGHGEQSGSWALAGSVLAGGLSAYGGATCSGGMDCLGSIVPQVFGTLILLPPAGITAVVQEMRR